MRQDGFDRVWILEMRRRVHRSRPPYRWPNHQARRLADTTLTHSILHCKNKPFREGVAKICMRIRFVRPEGLGLPQIPERHRMTRSAGRTARGFLTQLKIEQCEAINHANECHAIVINDQMLKCLVKLTLPARIPQAPSYNVETNRRLCKPPYTPVSV